MTGRVKIRPGMMFRVVGWDERFEIQRVHRSEVVARYYRDFTVTVMSLWELLDDLNEGEVEEIQPSSRPVSRRRRRQDAADYRWLRAHGWRRE